MYMYICIYVCVYIYIYIYICSYISMNIIGDTSNLLWIWSITLGVFLRKPRYHYFSCFDDYVRSNYLFFFLILWGDVIDGIDGYLASNGSMGYTVYIYAVVSSFQGNIFKNKQRNLILWLIFIGVILGTSLVFLCRIKGISFDSSSQI